MKAVKKVKKMGEASLAPKASVAKAKITLKKVKRHPLFGGYDYFVQVENDPNMVSLLLSLTQEDALYSVPATVNITKVLPHYEKLKEFIENDRYPNVKVLLDILSDLYKDFINKYNVMVNDGKISYDVACLYYKIGDEVSFTYKKQICGGRIANLHHRRSMFGHYLDITVNFVDAKNGKFSIDLKNIYLSEFEGVKDINSLDIKKITPETKAMLSERGRKFVELVKNVSHVEYVGNMQKEVWWGDAYFQATGRAMIDGRTFQMKNPNYDSSRDVDEEDLEDSVLEQNLFMCPPLVKGFSFVNKQWGEFIIDQISEVQFDTEAFNTLVLDQDTKDTIFALVKHSNQGFKDIIKGKSGGCIFLLHGPPGVGKTLTAEAIAEYMKRPLYSISVGELGVEPAELEENLRGILEISTIWNAVILLDEVDIFLEKRQPNDIVRNAMVGIFLRLLEYHNGLMFLTTNRVESFDPAFHSRISIALNYKSHSAESRKKIWHNLLSNVTSSINLEDDSELYELAVHDINGRQIKNCIRLAQALAKEADQVLGKEHLLKCIKLQESFHVGDTDSPKAKNMESVDNIPELKPA